MVALGEYAGRYLLEAELGSGGMGRVYRAQDTRLQRTVAVKILDVGVERGLEEAELFKARMLREARLAASLNHPQVVAVYDVGEEEGAPYVVLEYVPGKSLRRFVGDDQIPWKTRVRWLLEAAQALEAAHTAGLVHRDVKPENVLVREDGRVKVADFGIARRQRAPELQTGEESGAVPTLTVPGTLVGTPRYMAPEQIKGETLDGRSDQFSWGVMAFELLCGTTPWPKGDMVSLVAAMMTEAPAVLRDRNPEIPVEVSEVVARALSRDRQARFPAMQDLIAALLPVVTSTATPTAKEPTTVVEGQKKPAAVIQDKVRVESTTSSRKRAWGLPVTAAVFATSLVLWSLERGKRTPQAPTPSAPAIAVSIDAGEASAPVGDGGLGSD